MRIDPVCGRAVGTDAAVPFVDFRRRRYFFCSPQCRAAFEREAERARLRELARAGALLSRGKVRWGRA